MEKKQKIVLGMSGGVDSTAALILLQKQGYEVVGVSLELPVWDDEQNLLRENLCCTDESLCLAAKICQKYGAEHHRVPSHDAFTERVINYFKQELEAKRTPNPCVICNRYFKFAQLIEFAEKIGADLVATGHYAAIKTDGSGLKQLVRPKDKQKDQTYNLSFLTQEQLQKIIFPLADIIKEDVYELVKNEGLEEFNQKKQSQDFCFVAGSSLPAFIEKEVGLEPGLILDEEGNMLGKHQGLFFYTIGQRKGIGLGGGPYFVKAFDIDRNALIVTKDEAEVSAKGLEAFPCNFISGKLPEGEIKIGVKIRSQHPLSSARFIWVGDGRAKVEFEEPQKSVTPGQLCAFYDGEVCLGGGIIEKSLN